MRRLKTGIPGLDSVLHGGLIPDRLYLVDGHPGSGKTTAALQFLLEGTRAGETCLYLTLSETREELTAGADSHGWSTEGIEIVELIADQHGLDGEGELTMLHPSEVELTETTRKVLEAIERINPHRLVFDSLSELRLVAQSSLRYRRQILALKQFFIGRRCTVMMLDDRTAEGPDLQLHSIAHGVIALDNRTPPYGRSQRELQVLKFRGSDFSSGYHDFAIRRGGLTVFPRLVASDHGSSFERASIESGVPALDTLLGGGVERGTSTLLIGAPGCGKSSIALQYAVAAAQRGDHAATFMFDETKAALLARSTGLGLAIKEGRNPGQVTLRQINPIEVSAGEFTQIVRDSVEQDSARVVIIDSLNGYLNAMPQDNFPTAQLHELLSYLNNQGVVTFLIVAQSGMVGASMVSPVDASYLADTVVLLRYFEHAGTVKKAISVLKKRTGAHEESIRELSFDGRGIHLSKPLLQLRGSSQAYPSKSKRLGSAPHVLSSALMDSEVIRRNDDRVLILPATRRDGEVTCALLQRCGMSCEIVDGADSLGAEIEAGAGAVVLTDTVLSDARFANCLRTLERQPVWSELPIVLLSHAGLKSPATTRMRSSLKNVTLLNRPTSLRTLLSSVQAALRSRERQYQIRDQMETLRETEEAVRQRERQLHTLAENSPDILSRFDREFRYLFVNQAAARMTGLSCGDFIGRTSRELGLSADLSDTWEESLREVFTTARQQSVEFTYPDSIGRLRHYTSSLVPEFGATGVVETILCVARDITERKNAEDALRLADRRKDEFLVMLAHELRNPLAPIRNASELLGRTLPADPQIQATVSIVKRQVTHLTRLVDDLLDVSRITQGRIELQRQPIELSSVIGHALESVEPLLREKRHRVLLDSRYHSLYVDGDNARLVQCVVNVLSNAAKYTDPSGEIRIQLREESSSAVVTISDNGVGISKELLPRIFELFVQSERSLDRSQGGLGIGLSVVKRLVEMHGGQVNAHSAGPGRGSTFEIRLPLVTAPSETARERPRQKVLPRRILIVDDNSNAADSLALVLKLSGHQTESAYTPEDALERATAFKPDVVLLDIGLPRISGYELANRIRCGDKLVQLVAITGYGQREDIQRAQSAGFDAHIVKPVDFSALDRILAAPRGRSHPEASDAN